MWKLRKVTTNVCSDELLTFAHFLLRCILESMDRCEQRVGALEEKMGEYGKVTEEKKKAAMILKIK